MNNSKEINHAKTNLISISCDEIGSLLHIYDLKIKEKSKGWSKTSWESGIFELSNSCVQEKSESWLEKYSTRAWFQRKDHTLSKLSLATHVQRNRTGLLLMPKITKISVFADMENKCLHIFHKPWSTCLNKKNNLDLIFCWLEFYSRFNVILIWYL